MTDTNTRRPIRVSTGGTSGPYIMASVKLLEKVRRLLINDIPHWVDHNAISVDRATGSVVINLGRSVDPRRVQLPARAPSAVCPSSAAHSSAVLSSLPHSWRRTAITERVPVAAIAGRLLAKSALHAETNFPMHTHVTLVVLVDEQHVGSGIAVGLLRPRADVQCRVGGQPLLSSARTGLAVHTMSPSGPPSPAQAPAPGRYQAHLYGEPDAVRQAKNIDNVALYFQITSGQKILQIAAGDYVYPDALSEDVYQYSDKTQPKLLTQVGEQLGSYLPTGMKFDKVVVVNARNLLKSNTDYKWLFEIAGPVMASGATTVIAGFDQNQPSIRWVMANEHLISGLGFAKISPPAAGATEQAETAIRVLPGGIPAGPGLGTAGYSNANAVQVVWRKS